MYTKTSKSSEHLSSLTIMEMAELIKPREDCFGVETSVVKTFTYSPDPVNLTSNNLSESNKFDVLLEELPTHQETVLGENSKISNKFRLAGNPRVCRFSTNSI